MLTSVVTVGSLPVNRWRSAQYDIICTYIWSEVPVQHPLANHRMLSPPTKPQYLHFNYNPIVARSQQRFNFTAQQQQLLSPSWWELLLFVSLNGTVACHSFLWKCNFSSFKCHLQTHLKHHREQGDKIVIETAKTTTVSETELLDLLCVEDCLWSGGFNNYYVGC